MLNTKVGALEQEYSVDEMIKQMVRTMKPTWEWSESQCWNCRQNWPTFEQGKFHCRHCGQDTVAWVHQDKPNETAEFSVEIIPNSRNHGGKTMLLISCGPKDDIKVWNLEVSAAGVFAYAIDDGAS
jgi:hypothetical protein